jgi:hypothetical protein
MSSAANGNGKRRSHRPYLYGNENRKAAQPEPVREHCVAGRHQPL